MAYTDIDEPSEHFNTVLYNGSSNNQLAITGVGFQPDFTWLKSRSSAWTHGLFLKANGTGAGSGYKYMASSSTAAVADTWGTITFGSDGFTGVSSGYNGSFSHDFGAVNNTFVSWHWKANGGTTTTNDASATGIGNTDSVYQANTTAGFSIVTFSGTGSGMTVAHGLGGTPTLIISKSKNDTEKWSVHTTVIDGSLDYLRLSETDTAGNSSFSLPTSTVFGYNGSNNYVVYCFRSIQGYSKIGKYIGNGTGANSSANGTFVYTGFKPAWVMVKATTVAQGWNIFDNKRTPTNEMGAFLFANTADAETTGYDSMDFLSNGFKLRKNLNGTNDSGQTFIYIAFAENPFVSSKGVPTTAR